MKEGLNKDAVAQIATSISKAYPAFNQRDFCKTALAQLHTLELKQRVQHIIHALHQYLPDDFEQSAAILQRTQQHWAPKTGLTDFCGWPLVDYVAVYGLQHPQLSLQTLKQLTSLFSAEFAIRTFLIAYPRQTLQALSDWCYSDCHHVRRLVSEGSRPRLPWGQQLPDFIKDPNPILPLLNALVDDESDYVRRSVANNLNDISKDHPQLVIEQCQQWLANSTPNRQWLVKHATRTLVKQGHPQVFQLLGYDDDPQLTISSLLLNKAVINLGDTLQFNIDIASTASKPQKMVIDYAIHHRKANGQLSAKVFKLKNLKLAPAQSIRLSKFHPIKPITTRNYYAGEHFIEILINGQGVCKQAFTLHTQ